MYVICVFILMCFCRKQYFQFILCSVLATMFYPSIYSISIIQCVQVLIYKNSFYKKTDLFEAHRFITPLILMFELVLSKMTIM